MNTDTLDRVVPAKFTLTIRDVVNGVEFRETHEITFDEIEKAFNPQDVLYKSLMLLKQDFKKAVKDYEPTKINKIE